MWVIVLTLCKTVYVRLFREVLQHTASLFSGAALCHDGGFWDPLPQNCSPNKIKGMAEISGRGKMAVISAFLSSVSRTEAQDGAAEFLETELVFKTHRTRGDVPSGIRLRTVPTNRAAPQLTLCSIYIDTIQSRSLLCVVSTEDQQGTCLRNSIEAMMSNTHQLYGCVWERFHTLSNSQGLLGLT